jgi:hypothetical protein
LQCVGAPLQGWHAWIGQAGPLGTAKTNW